MDSLIRKLEEATGPSRELDAEIAAHPLTQSFGIVKGAPIDAVLSADGMGMVTVPRFTFSLDAAMTLVPEHYSYELAWSAAGPSALRRARLWDWRRSPMALDPDNNWEASAKTLPLALVLASLKAIQSSKNSETGRKQ